MGKCAVEQAYLQTDCPLKKSWPYGNEGSAWWWERGDLPNLQCHFCMLVGLHIPLWLILHHERHLNCEGLPAFTFSFAATTTGEADIWRQELDLTLLLRFHDSDFLFEVFFVNILHYNDKNLTQGQVLGLFPCCGTCQLQVTADIKEVNATEIGWTFSLSSKYYVEASDLDNLISLWAL